jgi:hypothetical protein
MHQQRCLRAGFRAVAPEAHHFYPKFLEGDPMRGGAPTETRYDFASVFIRNAQQQRVDDHIKVRREYFVVR